MKEAMPMKYGSRAFHLMAVTVLLFMVTALSGCGGGGTGGGGSTGFSGGGQQTATVTPQVLNVTNLNNPGEPIRQGDWCQVSGNYFGNSQQGSHTSGYVLFSFQNGTSGQADAYQQWSDTSVTCRVPLTLKRSKGSRDALAITVIAADSDTSGTPVQSSYNPTPNPSPAPTPPTPTPTITPTPTPTPTPPTPTPTPTVTPTPTPTKINYSSGWKKDSSGNSHLCIVNGVLYVPMNIPGSSSIDRLDLNTGASLGTVSSGLLDRPNCITVNNNYIFVGSRGNNTIVRFNKDFSGGTTINTGVSDAWDGIVDISANDRYVFTLYKWKSDHRVLVTNLNGTKESFSDWTYSGWQDPSGIEIGPDSKVYITNTFADGIMVFQISGGTPTEIRPQTGSDGKMENPVGICVDANCIYVADALNYGTKTFSLSGDYLGGYTGTYGTGNGQFQSAHGICVDSSGNLYVTDLFNNSVQRINKL